MKLLYVLPIFLGLCACSGGKTYSINVKTESLPAEDLQDARMCTLEYHGDANQKSIQGKEFAKYIEHILSMRGIQVTTDKKASCTIGYSYNIEGPFTQQHSSPIIGVTGTQSTTSYTTGSASVYGNTAYGSATTNSINFPTYGVTGYRYYNTQYYTRWLAMVGVGKDGSELWNAYVSSNGSSNDLSEIFPLMAHVAGSTIMTNTKDSFSISESEAQKIKETMHLQE